MNTASSVRRPATQLLPAMAGLLVAMLLVGGASTVIQLSPASEATSTSTYDPADVPPPDPAAQQKTGNQAVVRSPLVSDATSTTTASVVSTTNASGPSTVASGSCQASYYSTGQYTASGEPFDPSALTASHATLAFGTLVRVTNQANGESVIVRVNDRGGVNATRCLDLSAGAFAAIASPSTGVIIVQYEVLA